MGLLYLLGRQLERRSEEGEEDDERAPPGDSLAARWWSPTGVILAFAWSAYPYTDFVLQANTNDSLVAALVVGALLVISSPPARGALAALGGLTKFASFALVPLLAAGPRAGLASRDAETGDGPLSSRRIEPWRCSRSASSAVSALLLLQAVLDPGLATFYDRTIASQINRDSPFSVWGQTPSARVAPARHPGRRGGARDPRRLRPAPPQPAADRRPRRRGADRGPALRRTTGSTST